MEHKVGHESSVTEQTLELTPASAKAVAAAEKEISAAVRQLTQRLGGAEDRLRSFAHEIRTPMSALLAYSDMLRRCEALELSQDQIIDYGATIHEATLRVLATAERTLDEHVTDERRSRSDGIDFREFANVLLKTFAAQADSLGVELKIDIDDHFPELNLDRVLLDGVLSNLISNALKFTPRGGNVSIQARVDHRDDAIIFVVSDTGRGFPADVLLKLENGETFVSNDGPRGWGRGLKIVRDHLTRMGAEFEVSNLDDGKGAIATIRFPREAIA